MDSSCRRTSDTSVNPPAPRQRGASTLIALAALFAALAAQPAFANGNGNGTTSKTTTTRIVEWDLPTDVLSDGFDARPGAIAVDLYGPHSSNNVWFVTRNGFPTKVYRVTMPRDIKIGNANWTSWSMSTAGAGPTGGFKKIKPSYDRRFVFVRTLLAVQRIDTQHNKVSVFLDPVSSVSDIAVDNSNRVYFASNGIIKRIKASAPGCAAEPCPTTEVVEWAVGGGVGNCLGGPETEPCIAGIAVHPKYQHLVYYSVPDGDYIGELDTNSKSCSCPSMNAATRRWSLANVGAAGPRQLNIDRDGIIWVVTASGHLVSLNPKTNRMTSHRIPSSALNDPFGVAPDGGMIGFTDHELDSLPQRHKVAMLIPRGNGVNCPPTPMQVQRTEGELLMTPDETSQTDCGFVCPIGRTVNTDVDTNGEGTFVQAIINDTQLPSTRSSLVPLGITPDFDRATGSFFFAVGVAEDNPIVKRIGHARLTRDHNKGKHDRDDEDCDDDGKPRGHDDDDDDDGKKNDVDNDDDNDGKLDYEDDDDDNDGIKNQHDTKDGKENQYNYRSDLAASQSEAFEVTTLPGALALLVTALADNPLTQISIEVRNAAGQVVGTSIAAVGVGLVTLPTPAAGIYTVKVKNHGLTAAGIDTMVLTRDPRLP
jgi:streptogramin lyase